MRARLVLKAFLRFRNIIIFLAALSAAALVSDPTALPNFLGYNYAVPDAIAVSGSIIVYLGFVMQTLLSKNFHDDFNKKEKIRHIQDMSYQCNKLSTEAKRNTNSTYLQKMKKVMDDKNEILDSFLKGERGYIKEKIVEQTLNLVISYVRLLNNFCIRSREMSNVDVSTVADRINTNNRKLSFVKDMSTVDDIKKVMEMDEKMISRLKDEKKDLERISAKLDYMESTVNMFKHQVLSSVESEEMLEKLESAMNEAEALDSVLEVRRKSKVRGL
jgi:hypothetical protein